MKALTLLAAAAALAGWAMAAETPAKPPCENFAWPMAREAAAFAAAPEAASPSGTVLTAWPEGATRLALGPFDATTFPVAPGRAPKEAANAQGGWVVLPAPAKGALYQVTIDGRLWVDAVQDGRTLSSEAHTSDATCTLFHKSVRFRLADGPVTLQFSGNDAASVVFTVLPAE